MGVNTVIKDYGTDILNAIRENNLERLKIIFHKHLRTDKKIQKLCTSDIKHRPTKKFACPIILAARQETPRILKYMLDHGTDPNFIHHTVFSSKRLEIVTALHICADLGYYDNLQALLDANADCNIIDHNQETPLHLTIKKADKTMTRMLLSRGADPGALDRRGNAALHIATMYGHLQLVRNLLQYNADVYQKGQGGAIAPHIAAKEGHIHLIQLFCSKDVGCVNIKLPCFADRREKTLLHLAAESGHVETVLALLHQFEADVNAKDSDENTALQCTVLNRFDTHRMRDKDYFTETAKVLIKFGVAINEKNAFGDTALHLAAMNQFQRIVEILVNLGASPFIENDEHLKPIDVVPDFDPVAKQLLKNAMLNPRPQPSQSMTSLRRDLDLSMMDNSSMRFHRFDDSRSEMSYDDREHFSRLRSKSQSSFMSATTYDSQITVEEGRPGKTDHNDNRTDHHQEQEIAALYTEVNKPKKHKSRRDDDHDDDHSITVPPKSQLTSHSMQDEMLRMHKQFKRYEESVSEFSQQDEDEDNEYLTMQNRIQGGKCITPKVNPRSTSSKTSTMTSLTTNKSQFEGDNLYDETQDQFVRKTKGSTNRQNASEGNISKSPIDSTSELQQPVPANQSATDTSTLASQGNIRVNAVAGKPGTIEVSYDGGPNGPISITVDTNQNQFGVQTPGGEFDSSSLQQPGFHYPNKPAPSYDKLKHSTETLATSVGEYEHAYSQSSYLEDYSRDNLDVSVDSSELAETPHHNNPDPLRRAIHQSVSDAMAADTPPQMGKPEKKTGWNKPQAREPEFDYMNIDMLAPPPRPPRHGKEENNRNSQYMNIDSIAPPPRPPKSRSGNTQSSPREVTPPRELTPPPRPPKSSDQNPPISQIIPRKEEETDKYEHAQENYASKTATTHDYRPDMPAKPKVVTKPKVIENSRDIIRSTHVNPVGIKDVVSVDEDDPSPDFTPNSTPMKSFQHALAAARLREDNYSSNENLDETHRKHTIQNQTVNDSSSDVFEHQAIGIQKKPIFTQPTSHNLKDEYISHTSQTSQHSTHMNTHIIISNTDTPHVSSPIEREENYPENEDRPPFQSQPESKLVFSRPGALGENLQYNVRRGGALSPVPRLPRGTKSIPSDEQTHEEQQIPDYPSRAMQVSSNAHRNSSPVAGNEFENNEVFHIGGGDKGVHSQSIEYIDDSFGSEDIRMYTGTQHGDNSFSSEYKRGLNMHVSTDMPKAYTRQQTASARRAFMVASPARIESGSEMSDNEFNTSYDTPSRYSLVSPTRLGTASVPASPESPVDQMAEVDHRRRCKVRLIGPQPRPYRSFGKIDTNTDALLEALEESREEIMSDPGGPVHAYDPPVRAFSTNDMHEAYHPVDIDHEEDTDIEIVTCASQKPKRPLVVKPSQRQQQVQSPRSEYQYVSAEDTQELHVTKPSSNTAELSVAESTFKQNIKFIQSSPSSMQSYNVEQDVSQLKMDSQSKSPLILAGIPPFKSKTSSHSLVKPAYVIPKPSPRTSIEPSKPNDEYIHELPKFTKPVHNRIETVLSEPPENRVDTSFDEDVEVSMYEENRNAIDISVGSSSDVYTSEEDEEVARISRGVPDISRLQSDSTAENVIYNEKHLDAIHLNDTDIIANDLVIDRSTRFKLTTTHDAKFEAVGETQEIQRVTSEQSRPSNITSGKPARPATVKPQINRKPPPISAKPTIRSAKPKLLILKPKQTMEALQCINKPSLAAPSQKPTDDKALKMEQYVVEPITKETRADTQLSDNRNINITLVRPTQTPPSIPDQSPPPPLPANSPPSLAEFKPTYPSIKSNDDISNNVKETHNNDEKYPPQHQKGQPLERDNPFIKMILNGEHEKQAEKTESYLEPLEQNPSTTQYDNELEHSQCSKAQVSTTAEAPLHSNNGKINIDDIHREQSKSQPNPNLAQYHSNASGTTTLEDYQTHPDHTTPSNKQHHEGSHDQQTSADELSMNVSFEREYNTPRVNNQKHKILDTAAEPSYINNIQSSQSEDKENKKGSFLAFSSIRKKKKKKSNDSKLRDVHGQSSPSDSLADVETKSKRKGLFHFGKKKEDAHLTGQQPTRPSEHHIVSVKQHHIISGNDEHYNNIPVSAAESMRAITPDEFSTDSDASSVGSPTGIEGTVMGKRANISIDRNDTVRENDRKAGFFDMPSIRRKRNEQAVQKSEETVNAPKQLPIKWSGPTDISSAALNTDLDNKVEHDKSTLNNVKNIIKNSDTPYKYEESNLDNIIPLPESKTTNITIAAGNRLEKMIIPSQDRNLDDDVSVGSTDKDTTSTNSDSQQTTALMHPHQESVNTDQHRETPDQKTDIQNLGDIPESDVPFRRQASRRGRKKGRPLSDGSQCSSKDIVHTEQTHLDHNARNNQPQQVAHSQKQHHIMADVQIQNEHRDMEIHTPYDAQRPGKSRSANALSAHKMQMQNSSQQLSHPHGNDNMTNQRQYPSTRHHKWGQHGNSRNPSMNSNYEGNVSTGGMNSRNTSSSSVHSYNRTNSTSSTASRDEPVVEHENRSRQRSRDTSIMGKMFAAARPTTNVQVADVEREEDAEYRNRRYKKNKRRQHSHDAAVHRQKQIMNTSLDSGAYKRGTAAMHSAKSMGALNDSYNNQQQSRSQRIHSADPGPPQQNRRHIQNNEAQMQATLQSMNMSTDVDDVFIPSNPRNLADNAMQKVSISTEYSEAPAEVDTSSGRWWGDSGEVEGAESPDFKCPAARNIREINHSSTQYIVSSLNHDQQTQEQQHKFKRQQKKATSTESMRVEPRKVQRSLPVVSTGNFTYPRLLILI